MVIRAPGPRGTQAGSYAELDDRMLVLDFQAGQVEAFVEIHHRYGALARHVCGRFLPNNQDVDEALQETWIRVFQGLHRFNGRFALQSWVARIATNVSLDILRARARRPQLDDQPIDEHEREEGGDGPEEEVEKLIQRDMVIAVLAGLPDAHRRALVLRELEGRSHKEIAGELDISPAQAKALIHRAKGTFRREWLRAATERHGLAGFFLLPVIWLSKLGGLARRVADRAGEVAHVGGTEVVTQTAQAVASPVVPMAASGVGEKIIAAGLTLVVAGGVTVGAATVVRNRGDRDKPEAVVAAPVVVPSDDPAPSEPAVVEEIAEKEAKKDPLNSGMGANTEPKIAPPVLEEPLAQPTAEPSPTASAGPSETPSPGAAAAPEPVPFVPPSWSLTFATDVSSEEVCRCDPGSVASSDVRGTPDEGVTFSHSVRGGALDAEGDTAWELLLRYWGEAADDGGSLTTEFSLLGSDGLRQYEGTARLVESEVGPAGETSFRFSGSYRLSQLPVEIARLPNLGELSVILSFAPDGTLYGTEFQLFDMQ